MLNKVIKIIIVKFLFLLFDLIITMPTFDIISEFDKHEIKNAVDQANKEVTTRFDFKGTDSSFELTDDKLIMTSESTFQLQQMFSVVCTKLSRRGVDIACMEVGDPKPGGKCVRQEIIMKQGLDSTLAKNTIKFLSRIARILDMLLLVRAYRHYIYVVEQNIGSHQHRIIE